MAQSLRSNTKKSFKMTELGPLPEGRLSEFGRSISGVVKYEGVKERMLQGGIRHDKHI
ncbi:MAG TPA: hypothetical protein HA232_01325 [Methanocellales archaeon]|nr:hypothetical protein [Methanocellales archaeon]